MKRKVFVVGLLVLICLGLLVVEGISQPVTQFRPVNVQRRPAPPPPPPPSSLAEVPEPAPNFAVVQPQQQEWTFEQLVEALKGVRTRQKELQEQEADLLAKMAKKVEEKRQDLSKSEATLEQLRGESGRIDPAKRFGEKWEKGEKKK